MRHSDIVVLCINLDIHGPFTPGVRVRVRARAFQIFSLVFSESEMLGILSQHGPRTFSAFCAGDSAKQVCTYGRFHKGGGGVFATT